MTMRKSEIHRYTGRAIVSLGVIVACQASSFAQQTEPASASRPLDSSSLTAQLGELKTVAKQLKSESRTGSTDNVESSQNAADQPVEKLKLKDSEWKRRLTRQQFNVTRKHGTERAFSGKHWNNKRHGTYKCVCCGQPVFDSETKFDSGTGWPSFYQPLSDKQIGTSKDNKLFYTRIEVHCSRCDAHLGHVFNDGPAPTGLRYCINSVALDFEERSEESPE